MRRIAFAILALGILASCGDPNRGNNEESSPTTDPPAVTTPANDPEPVEPVSEEESSEALYIELLQTQGVPASDPQLSIDLGHAICHSWDVGVSFDRSVTTLVGSGFSAGDAGSIMGAAAYFLCPEHLDAAEAWSQT